MSQVFNPSFDFLKLSDKEIIAILKKEGLALTIDEAKKIHNLVGRPPTLAECVLWSIQGSEHCSYKSTRIHLKTLPTSAPNVILGPKEDAGVVEVAKDGHGIRYGVVISHESHNHPSQIVPFEGAATGVGGNVRDVSCMGAEVIAVADTLRFGDIHHSKTHWIDHGVVSGIAGYGNPIGVPNLTGDVFYDPAYQDNCLVTVVTLGIVREDQLIHSYAPKNATGYDLILVGKPTDNSGFGGASFASIDLNEEDAEQNKGAVQEPNAFLGRHLLKTNLALFKKLAEQNLIDQVGFKDLGAGGVACASVEIADGAGYGATVDLENVHVSMENLPPQVILCAETQERYLWAVPPQLTPMILVHYNEEWQLPKVSRGARASVIGKITNDGRYTVRYRGTTLVSAKASDVTSGILYDRPHQKARVNHQATALPQDLLQRLSHENVASRQPIFECYDKQVQGRTLLERGQADAGVLQPFNSSEYPEAIQKVGVALSVGHRPGQSAFAAVIECMRKVVAVGAKPAAITDCLCFGNPEKPEQMQEIIDAIHGIGEACRAVPLYDHPDSPTPVVSGNVSLYNESENGAIPGSPIISCLGVLEDINLLTTPDFKQVDSAIVLIADNLAKNEIFSVIELIRVKLVNAVQVFGFGGLEVALAKMSFKNDIGFKILALDRNDEVGGFVVEVAADKLKQINEILHKNRVNFMQIGKTIPEQRLVFMNKTYNLMEAKAIFNNGLRELRK